MPTDPRLAARAEVVRGTLEMLALKLRQHEGAGDPVENICRRCSAAALLEPRIPSGADIGTLRHLLATEAGRPATRLRKAECSRIKLGAPVLQISPKRILRGVAQHDRQPSSRT